MNDPILIRTDASLEIGTGHFMRCYALADAFIDNGERAVFCLSKSIPELLARLDVRHFAHRTIGAAIGTEDDAVSTATLAKEIGAKWVVLDGYNFGSRYQASLQTEGLKILMLDDFSHAERYSADLVLNQNASANSALYVSKLEGSQLLLGPRYAVIRREFMELMDHRAKAVNHKVDNILVTLGGSDPNNMTAKVLTCLKDVDERYAKIVVLLGAANRNYNKMVEISRSRMDVHIVQNPQNVAEIMASTDLAIAAGGTSTYELCYLGIPFIAVIIADNQIDNVASLQERGITLSIDGRKGLICGQLLEALVSMLSQADRAKMKQKELEMVDGYGADRVLMHLREARIWLRRAVLDDERRTLDWSNDQVARANSFHPEKIRPEVHAINFRKWLSSKETMLLVANDAEDNPIGQVRFDFAEDEASISISLDKRFRGRGLGSEMIRYSCKMATGTRKVDKVNALVKIGNDASVRAFEKAGFVFVARENRFGQECLHYVSEK